jgi:hypothetical protein
MTKAEAQRECERLARESPERETHRWILGQQRDGEWTVIKIGLPPTTPLGGEPETRADEKPPTPDDPRSSSPRGIPGYGG